jgi:DNA-binding SARP family transcriptional activator
LQGPQAEPILVVSGALIGEVGELVASQAREGTTGTVELQLLGAFELRTAGRPVALPPTAQRVLAFIALADQPLSRGYVGGALWPERTDARAAANLRTAVWRLQTADPRLLSITNNRRLSIAEAVEIDYRRRSSLARGVLKDEPVDPATLETLCRPGELLPDWYDDWLDLERERYRLLRVSALEHVAERLSQLGSYGDAAAAGLAAVASDPLRETAHRALIRVFLAEGNAFEALRQFELYRELSLRHIGLEPSDQTTRLVRHLQPQIRVSRAVQAVSRPPPPQSSGTSRLGA